MKLVYILLLFLFPLLSFSQNDSLIDILNSELNREFEILSKQDIPAYYIEYRVSEVSSVQMSAWMGNLSRNDRYKGRILSIAVRVGDYYRDNTHIIKDSYIPGSYGYANLHIPLDNIDIPIKNTLWIYTERAYNKAVTRYEALVNKLEEKGDSSDLPDFTKENSSVYFEANQLKTIENVDANQWKEKLENYSAQFLVDTNIEYGAASLSYYFERKYFVNSEGTKLTQNFNYSQLSFSVTSMSEKNELVPFYWSYYSFLPDSLPSDEEINEGIKSNTEILKRLKDAPEAEPFSGPAILSAEAAGVFFHEIFGHRIEGDRLLDENDGHTFKDKLNKQVLPKFMSLYFDPNSMNFKGTDLFGFYEYDDQGVKSQKVNVVENGILKEFLRTRVPYEKSLYSNGHSRAQAGEMPVSRQSNMFVVSSEKSSDDDLRKALIKEAKKQKKEYGYYFKEVIGGFTYTNRYSPSVFNIIPIEVYRIYVDGRPDELVRGVSLIGTPLLMFANIEKTGETYDVFNGYCGAESGSVPVSTIAPALFVKQIETQKDPVYKIETPVLPMPIKK